MQRSFQIEEDSKVSETSSFPGRASSESGITVCYYAKLRLITRVVFMECRFLTDGLLWQTVVSDEKLAFYNLKAHQRSVVPSHCALHMH